MEKNKAITILAVCIILISGIFFWKVSYPQESKEITINTYLKVNIPFNYSEVQCPGNLPKEAVCFLETENKSFIFYGTIENGAVVIHYLPMQYFIDDK